MLFDSLDGEKLYEGRFEQSVTSTSDQYPEILLIGRVLSFSFLDGKYQREDGTRSKELTHVAKSVSLFVRRV